jgi:hypothetical protein
MASLIIPALPSPLVPVPAQAPAPVNAVAAALPGMLLQADAEALPLPASQQVLPSAAQDGEAGRDGAAMRPDQVIMARQLTWPNQDGGALATAWRGMVRTYGAQLAAREQQANAGQLPAALLQAGQDPRLMRQSDPGGAPLDAWRFTVHAGTAREQHLRIVDGDADQEQQKRRRRGRAALRLELVLDDGAVVTLQALPVGDGLMMELCAADARTVARLRDLQPRLEEAVERAGLRVLGWTWRAVLPDGGVHARLPAVDAAQALGLPVFRAMAELALLLPLGAADVRP